MWVDRLSCAITCTLQRIVNIEFVVTTLNRVKNYKKICDFISLSVMLQMSHKVFASSVVIEAAPRNFLQVVE